MFYFCKIQLSYLVLYAKIKVFIFQEIKEIKIIQVKDKELLHLNLQDCN